MMRASIFPTLFSLCLTYAWAGGGDRYNSSDSEDEFVVIENEGTNLTPTPPSPSAEEISEEEIEQVLDAIEDALTEDALAVVDRECEDAIPLFMQDGKLIYGESTPAENLLMDDNVSYHRCFLELEVPTLTLTRAEDREALCRRVFTSLVGGEWENLPSLESGDFGALLPKLVIPERTDDSGRNWRHTKKQKEGFSCLLSEAKPTNVLVRSQAARCTFVGANGERSCRLLQIFFKGLTCLGENEAVKAGVTFHGGGPDKASRQITYRGLTQHVLSEFSLSFLSVVSDFRTLDDLTGEVLALQVVPDAGFYLHWASTVTQKGVFGCPIELYKGIAVHAPHVLPKESTEDAITENVGVALQKGVTEVERGIRNIGRFLKKI